jgi:asparagine synthase (glutamine-hydrolysing)
MLHLLAHRGPDDIGTYESPEATIGARRLAIIDVAGGHQPALSEDKRIAVALNGEIYNHREIRAMLTRRGHSFRSGADTEVLPHLYEEYGVEFTALLRGMFALAVWDHRERRLVLARDRAGEKPMFYAEVPSGLVFASELKALLAHREVSRDIDSVSLGLYLVLQYVPGPRTILGSVQKLAPGHRLVHERHRTRIERYWDAVPGTPAHFRSRAGAARELREVLQDAVAAQLHADVPVGALLSGGLDSASVVALMTAVAPDPPSTFTVGFADHEFDERPYARHVARELGTRHTELLVEPPTFEDLERVVWHLDEPIGDQAALPTFLIARVASEHVKVVLTGEGSDELFGGYPRYRWYSRAERLRRFPSPLLSPPLALAPLLSAKWRRNLDLLFTPRSSVERHLAWVGVFDRADLDTLLAPDVAVSGAEEAERHLANIAEDWSRSPTVEQAMFIDFKTWLVDDILAKADRMTMAASIEARAPFVDQRVVEYAFALPVSARLSGPHTKGLLREALRDLLPAAVLKQGKRAFQVPVERWLRTRFAGTLRELLLARDAATAPLLRRKAVEALLSAEGREAGRRLWTLAVLELWLRAMLREPLPSDAPTASQM